MRNEEKLESNTPNTPNVYDTIDWFGKMKPPLSGARMMYESAVYYMSRSLIDEHDPCKNCVHVTEVLSMGSEDPACALNRDLTCDQCGQTACSCKKCNCGSNWAWNGKRE